MFVGVLYNDAQQFALRKFKLAAIDYYPRNIRKFYLEVYDLYLVDGFGNVVFSYVLRF